MNLTISPVILYKNNSKTTKKKNNDYNQGYFCSNLLWQDGLKYQILFKGIDKTQRHVLIKDAISKNNLPIKPETLDFIINPDNAKNSDRYESYTNIGANFIKAKLAAKFHQQYPLKFVNELADLEINSLTVGNKKTILKKIFSEKLLINKNGDMPKERIFTRMLMALIGAIASEDSENGIKNADKFINEFIFPVILSGEEQIGDNYFENFQKFIESKGKSFDDCYVQRVVSGYDKTYNIWYKDLLLAKKWTRLRSDSVRQEAIQEAINKIESGEINLDDATDELPYIRYKYPIKARIERLNFLQDKYNLNIEDNILLNQVFLFGSMLDNSTILKVESNLPLEYIGSFVLKACVELGYKKHHPDIPEHQARQRIDSFLNSENLSNISKNMMLWKYCQNTGNIGDVKQQAGLLTSLIAAIYINGKENGFSDAYGFIEENLGAELLGMENVQVRASRITQEEAQRKWQQVYDKHLIPKKERIRTNERQNKASLTRQEAINNAISKYNLKLTPKTLDYIFNRNSIQDERFDRYFNIGKLAYATFERQILSQKHPYKTPWQLTRIEQDGKNTQIAKTVRKMFDRNLYDDFDKTKPQPLGMYFFALLGAIIEEGEENGHKDFAEFLCLHAQEILEQNASYQAECENEMLNKKILSLGCNPDDIFIESKFDGAKCKNKIYYQGNLLAQINTKGKNGLKFAYETALREAVLRIEKAEHLKLGKSKEKIEDYRKPDAIRKAKLDKLCNKLGIEIQNYDLLNQAFLQGKTPNGVQIHYHDSYEKLEYIGDAILEYCIHRILIENKEEYNWQETINKLHNFTCNANLAKIGTRLKLDKYLPIPGHINDPKRFADLFEALIAVIYLDGGEDGFNNVIEFLKDNFMDEINT